MAGKAEQAQQIRDLKRQVSGIGTEEMTGVEFTMISPGHDLVTIYAVEDGRPLDVPVYRLEQAMAKTLDDGVTFMFVAEAKNAPEYKMGTIVCFLHVDSPERLIIEEIGLGAIKCRKHTLPSQSAWRLHGMHRHKQEWVAYQEFIEERKEKKREDRQDKQLEATLSIADRGQPPAVPFAGDINNPNNLGHSGSATKGLCDICGKTGLKRVSAHKSMVHKEG